MRRLEFQELPSKEEFWDSTEKVYFRVNCSRNADYRKFKAWFLNQVYLNYYYRLKINKSYHIIKKYYKNMVKLTRLIIMIKTMKSIMKCLFFNMKNHFMEFLKKKFWIPKKKNNKIFYLKNQVTFMKKLNLQKHYLKSIELKKQKNE